MVNSPELNANFSKEEKLLKMELNKFYIFNFENKH